MSLVSTRRDFDEVLQSSANLASAVFDCAQEKWETIRGWEMLYPTQARKVIALSFMGAVGALEEFVQGCFIRYMAGAKSPSGFQPRLRVGPCETLTHAGQVLTRRSSFDFERSFLSWSSWSEVVDRARIYFHRGSPFSSIDTLTQARLQDAFVIRNHVAHSSAKCRADFIELAKRHLGLRPHQKLVRGYDVGRLFMSAPANGFTPDPEIVFYFTAYFDLFRRVADVLAPP